MSAGFYDEIAEGGVFKFYINGEWRSTQGRTQKVLNPSTLETAFTITGKAAYLSGVLRGLTTAPGTGKANLLSGAARGLTRGSWLLENLALNFHQPDT